MNGTTRVGGYEIEVRRMNYPTLWHFSSGEHGRKEAGIYAFWTAVLARKGRRKVSGRALVTQPPGDRFDRIRREMREARAADRPAYRRIWLELMKRGRAIRYIRPASEREVSRWMKTHGRDARFAKRIRVPR
jgi:hypothetical protein